MSPKDNVCLCKLFPFLADKVCFFLRLPALEERFPALFLPEYSAAAMHVAAQCAHNLQAFLVLHHLFRRISMYHVPVLGRYHRHTVDGEVLVQLIERCRCSCTAAAGNRCSRLIGKSGTSAVKGTVQKGGNLSAGVGVVDRRTKDETICLLCLLHKLIHSTLKDTATDFAAGTTPDASGDRLISNLEDFCFDSIFSKTPATSHNAV